jgi:hypothetical protein
VPFAPQVVAIKADIEFPQNQFVQKTPVIGWIQIAPNHSKTSRINWLQDNKSLGIPTSMYAISNVAKKKSNRRGAFVESVSAENSTALPHHHLAKPLQTGLGPLSSLMHIRCPKSAGAILKNPACSLLRGVLEQAQAKTHRRQS